MHYLALIFDAPPDSLTGAVVAARTAVTMCLPLGEPMRLRLGSPLAIAAGCAERPVHSLSGLLWIEARDLNEALRLARDCGLERNALLELYSMASAPPAAARPAAASTQPPTEHP